MLAELARLDGHNHRRIVGDSELVESIRVLARAHQSPIWTRQRQLNQLCSTLREFYPAAFEAFPELNHSDAVAAELTTQIDGLELELADRLTIGEFESDPNRSADARCRKNHAGTSPIPEASGKSHVVVGDTHQRALRALANHLVGILHGRPRHNTPCGEHTAWGHRTALAA
jgi:hypothetical protein